MTPEPRSDDRIDPRTVNSNGPLQTGDGMGLMANFIMALRFFSRLPTGRAPHEVPDLNRMVIVLPITSVLIGLGPTLLLVGAVLAGLPPYFAASLAVAAMIMVTGAMADDALADAADGLFGGHTIERRLDIMKDSRHGTYGVAALALFILLRVTALGAMAAINPLAAGAVWLAAGVTGRSSAVWLAVALPPARTFGAAATAGRLSRRGFAMGMAFMAILLFTLGWPFTNVLAPLLAGALVMAVVLGWSMLCRRLVGGQTGDLIGALGALVEIAVLTAMVGFVRP